jgi:hypothetical protein
VKHGERKIARAMFLALEGGRTYRGLSAGSRRGDGGFNLRPRIRRGALAGWALFIQNKLTRQINNLIPRAAADWLVLPPNWYYPPALHCLGAINGHHFYLLERPPSVLYEQLGEIPYRPTARSLRMLFLSLLQANQNCCSLLVRGNLSRDERGRFLALWSSCLACLEVLSRDESVGDHVDN